MADMQNQLMELMEQAKKLQTNMEDAQKKLALLEVTGSAGAGTATVKITITGRYAVKRVNISQEVFREGKTILEDLIAAAFNDAVQKIEKETRGKMAELTKGLNLPPELGGQLGEQE
jgi:DNA-binding YbaB/EbfC family protein